MQAEMNTITGNIARVEQSLAQLSARDIDSLRRENQTLRTENRELRQALEAQQRHSARIEVRTNLTRLTPEQTLGAMQVYFSLIEGSSSSRSLVLNDRKEITHFRGWIGLRSLPDTLKAYHPNGCTLQELSAFLARQGLAVQNPTVLQDAIFAVLDIAEPRQT